jgi:hypothetical protein
MEDKPSGAWLLRYTPEKKQFILTVKYHGNILHFKVCYWLSGGDFFTSAI